MVCRRLSSFGLSGSLSGDIQSLSELQYLYVLLSCQIRAKLSSAINKTWKHGSCLMVLNLFGQAFALFDADESILIICRDLSYNNLSGPLPPNIGSLSNLESLHQLATFQICTGLTWVKIVWLDHFQYLMEPILDWTIWQTLCICEYLS